jgi:hypothetical protein
MKTKLVRGVWVVLFGYVLLAAGYFFYLEWGGEPVGVESREFGREAALKMRMEVAMPVASVRNYASEARASAATSIALGEHKYEKVGWLQALTEHFEADEKAARVAVAGFRGILQEEALTGVAGARSLALTIGVPPGEFDMAVDALRKIGQAEGFSVTKTDKTNDYLQLRAKNTSLVKTRDALVAIKGQGGKIEELVKLEREIMDLEAKIQDLGVQLGVFDHVNELCTVRFTLAERAAAPEGHPHWANVFAALDWAARVYLMLLAATAVGLLCLVLALVVAQKAKAILLASGER